MYSEAVSPTVTPYSCPLSLSTLSLLTPCAYQSYWFLVYPSCTSSVYLSRCMFIFLYLFLFLQEGWHTMNYLNVETFSLFFLQVQRTSLGGCTEVYPVALHDTGHSEGFQYFVVINNVSRKALWIHIFLLEVQFYDEFLKASLMNQRYEKMQFCALLPNFFLKCLYEFAFLPEMNEFLFPNSLASKIYC